MVATYVLYTNHSLLDWPYASESSLPQTATGLASHHVAQLLRDLWSRSTAGEERDQKQFLLDKVLGAFC